MALESSRLEVAPGLRQRMPSAHPPASIAQNSDVYVNGMIYLRFVSNVDFDPTSILIQRRFCSNIDTDVLCSSWATPFRSTVKVKIET